MVRLTIPFNKGQLDCQKLQRWNLCMAGQPLQVSVEAKGFSLLFLLYFAVSHARYQVYTNQQDFINTIRGVTFWGTLFGRIFKWSGLCPATNEGGCSLSAGAPRSPRGWGWHASSQRWPRSHRQRTPWACVKREESDPPGCGRLVHLEQHSRKDTLQNSHESLWATERFIQMLQVWNWRSATFCALHMWRRPDSMTEV